MTWVRIDEGFPEHPKVIAVGPIASWLHVCAIAYCNRQLTDGFIPASVLPHLSDGRRTRIHAAALVSAGLWEIVDGGWQIHDFLTYQPSRAKVETERAQARERMAHARERSPNVRPNNSRTIPEVRPNNSRSSPEVRTTRPVPTRTDPIEQVSDIPTSVDTPPSGEEIPRLEEIAAAYAAIALEQATNVGNPDGYTRKARQTALAHPDIARYANRWPTAPPTAVAAWLHGEKHSMGYYHDTLDNEVATVHHLHGDTA